MLWCSVSENAHPLLVAFSVLSNGRKLLHISTHSKSKEQIETFHGLRVISMMWIVAGHGFVSWQMVSVTNREIVDNVCQVFHVFVCVLNRNLIRMFLVAGSTVCRIHFDVSFSCGHFFLYVGILIGLPVFKGQREIVDKSALIHPPHVFTSLFEVSYCLMVLILSPKFGEHVARDTVKSGRQSFENEPAVLATVIT